MCYKKQNLLYSMERLGPLTRHHRRPKSHGGKHEGLNISYIPQRLHQAWHVLFANNAPARICEVINDHFIDPDVVVIAVPKELHDAILQLLSNPKK